jgi:uncharacterized protein (TIGR03083 family)
VDHLALLEGEVVAMAAALRTADPARDVPSCPGWTVQALTDHITAVHRWVLGALRNEGAPPYDETPATPDDYWQAASELVTRLRELPQDAPCWTFDRDDRPAAFWRRRQLQEVSVHRWDVDQHEIDETIAIRSMVYLALTYDHRLVDGADAARFLVEIKNRLEGGHFESELGL